MENNEKTYEMNSFISMYIKECAKIFCAKMIDKLSLEKNMQKGLWCNTPNLILFEKLKEEIKELESELKKENKDDIVAECCDIANFAMMIADNTLSIKYS